MARLPAVLSHSWTARPSWVQSLFATARRASRPRACTSAQIESRPITRRARASLPDCGHRREGPGTSIKEQGRAIRGDRETRGPLDAHRHPRWRSRGDSRWRRDNRRWAHRAWTDRARPGKGGRPRRRLRGNSSHPDRARGNRQWRPRQGDTPEAGRQPIDPGGLECRGDAAETRCRSIVIDIYM